MKRAERHRRIGLIFLALGAIAFGASFIITWNYWYAMIFIVLFGVYGYIVSKIEI